jgi:hypothetical protein
MKPNLKVLQKTVDAWNAKYPVGTKVVVTLDSGERKETVTRSEAEVLSGHSAVIWIEGIRGCYLLDRVRAIEEVTAR